jgi:hypothetical protein
MAQNLMTSKWARAGLLAAGLLIAAGATGIAQSREFRFSVSGSGSSQSADQQQAADDAFDKAKESVRLTCSGGNGETRGIQRTGSNCIASGQDENRRYTCMVFVRADCVTHVR